MQNPRVSLSSVGAREVRHGNTPAAHDTYSSIFPVHKLRKTELTNDGRSKWRLWPLRPAVSCTRGAVDWPKVVAVGAQQPISDFLGFIQMRDTLSTNGEHLRVAEVKSFPAISKSMRSVNGDQNGANLKKWSVLLFCTIRRNTLVRRHKLWRVGHRVAFEDWLLFMVTKKNCHDGIMAIKEMNFHRPFSLALPFNNRVLRLPAIVLLNTTFQH